MELIVERSGQVATLTLNRPERLNAVSVSLYRALLTSLIECDRDASVRAIVLTGAGRAFCVGAELESQNPGKPTAQECRAYVHTAQLMHQRLQRVSKPFVAAVNGHAVGAGLELALSCDFVIVAKAAKLRFPEVTLGTFVGGRT